MLNWNSAMVCALAAAGIVVVNVLVYWMRLKAVRLPQRPVAQQASMGVAVALAVYVAFGDPGWIWGSVAAIAGLVAGAFLMMTLMSRTPDRAMSVEVGQPAIDFTTHDSFGREVSLSTFRGSPVLLKFFRGHW